MKVQLDTDTEVSTEKTEDGRYAWCIRTTARFEDGSSALLDAGRWIGRLLRGLQPSKAKDTTP